MSLTEWFVTISIDTDVGLVDVVDNMVVVGVPVIDMAVIDVVVDNIVVVDIVVDFVVLS